MHFSLSAIVVSVISVTSVVQAIVVPKTYRAGLMRRGRTRVVSCRATGQYPIPVNNQCKPCSYKFPGASVCTATAATRCSTGFLSNNACVTTCPTGTYNQNGACSSCSRKYPGSATCTSSAATKCTTGFLANGACASVCPTGFVNAQSTKSCVACSRFDSQATSCTNGKIAACAAGSYLNSKSQVGGDCIPCTSVNSFAATCSASNVVTTCNAPYAVSADKRSCVLPSKWSFYLSSTIPNIPYDSNVQSSIVCARNAISEGSQVSVYDQSSSACFSSSTSATAAIPTLTWDADSAVVIVGSCSTNNKLIPAAKARCHDATLTPSSCTLSDSTACSTLLNQCQGSEFRNYNGLCQSCSNVYDNSQTCDLFNGATSCISGSALNNGTCIECSTFDDNAAECSANGTLTACNDGYILNDNACTVDPNAGSQVGLDNDWSYYPDSFLSGLNLLTNASTDQFDCANSVYSANLTLASFDPVANNCYGAMSADNLTTIITDQSGASVFVIESCAFNLGQVPNDQGNACYDVEIDSDSCTLDGGAPCS